MSKFPNRSAAACMAVAGLALLFSCGGGGNKKQEEKKEVTFQRVTPPVMMTDPQDQAAWLIEHWWDNFDFSDTLFLSQPDAIEQALVDYVAIAPHTDPAKAKASIARMMQKAEAADSAVYAWFREETEHYLWDPNSPVRNEELYLPVLENALASSRLDDLTKQQAAYRLKQAQLNRVGATATDFTYTLASGRQGRLSQIRSEYTLIFFNNPGCTACAELIDQIQRSPVFTRLMQEGRMTVLAVYPDEDLAEWRDYQDKMPKDWINSYSLEFVGSRDALYDLRAIPTMYLLDKDKTVLLKDPAFGQLEDYLLQQVNQ